MRYLVRTNPFREAMAWQKAMDRFFEEGFGRSSWSQPNDENGNWHALALDVSEDENALNIEASLPGINPNDVDISVHDGVLTIKAEVSNEKEEEKEGKVYLRERHYGSFQRAIRLPVDVDADAADATFENGVLHLILPKVEEAKPKRIAVSAS